MIRRAAFKVPLLHNKMQSVLYYNVTLLKAVIIYHFRQLIDKQKMKVGRAFPNQALHEDWDCFSVVLIT
jgi:hypothetical protein